MSKTPNPYRQHKYPSLPTGFITTDTAVWARLLEAMRSRLHIYAGESGRVEDSMVRVSDLLDLGIITPADLHKLNR